MDLFLFIILILAGFIIKYLADTINSLNGEIREIKNKCISQPKNVAFSNNASNSNYKMNDSLVKSIGYFKDMFDNK
jgi:predicted PurR-regulated permease PerM